VPDTSVVEAAHPNADTVQRRDQIRLAKQFFLTMSSGEHSHSCNPFLLYRNYKISRLQLHGPSRQKYAFITGKRDLGMLPLGYFLQQVLDSFAALALKGNHFRLSSIINPHR
jgi:hypothetical protein